MKMKKLALMAVSTGLLLAGCEEGMGPSGDVSQSFGGAIKGQVEMFANYLAESPLSDPSGDVNFPAMFASPIDSCSRFSKGGSITDTDYRVTYNCRGIAGQNSSTFDLVGTMSQSSVGGDLEKGYRYEVDLYQKVVFPTNTLEDTYKGLTEMVLSGGSIRYTSDFEMHITMSDHKPPVDYIWKRSVSRVYKPDNMNNPEESGKVSIEGSFMMNGKIGGGPGGVDLGITKFGFSISSKDLVYKRTCTWGFESGTITFVDGANNKIVFEYLCGSKNLTLNGKPVN